MNIEQAKLLAKGANHVKNVGAMYSFGVEWENPAEPVCFVCEMYRAGIVRRNQVAPAAEPSMVTEPGFCAYFGIPRKEAVKVTTGDYKTGEECYQVVKGILENHGYGYLLDDSVTEEIIPIRQPVYKDQFTPADAGFDWRKIGVTC